MIENLRQEEQLVGTVLIDEAFELRLYCLQPTDYGKRQVVRQQHPKWRISI